MKEKITQFDTFALNVSDAYTHKTVLGGIFSILYALIGIALVIVLIYQYIVQPDQISTKVIYDYNLPIADPDKDSFNLTVIAKLDKGTSDNMKTFNTFFRFYISYDLDSGQRDVRLITCINTEDSPQCSFALPSDFFNDSKIVQNAKKHSFQLGYMTCKEISDLEELKLIKIKNKELMEGCINTYEIFNYEWMNNNGMQFTYYLLHHYFEYPEISDQLTIKEYSVRNKLNRNLHERYSMDINYANINYNNYLFFGSKYDKTIFNWVDPEKTTQAKIGDGHSFTIIFSNRFKSRIFYYTIEKESFSMVLINLGGLLKIYGLLTALPYLWNSFYREKALLVLCTMFHFKSLNIDDQETRNRLASKKSDIGQSLIEKDRSDGFDWHNYSYGLYLKTKLFGCCCNKELKKAKNKILNSLECTSFVKFGKSKKWVDIAKYMPCYVEENNNLNNPNNVTA